MLYWRDASLSTVHCLMLSVPQRAAEAKIDMEEYQLGVLRFVYKYRRNVSYVGPLVSLALRRAHRVSHDSKSLKKCVTFVRYSTCILSFTLCTWFI